MPEVLGKIVTGTLDRVEGIPGPKGFIRVAMTSDEVVSTCPVTGQPDFYTVTIEFMPGELIIESKSLKLYLRKFATMGIFCEQLSETIRGEIEEVIHPRDIVVTVVQKSRGGISITAISSGPQTEWEDIT